MQETRVQSLGQEDTQEKEMATHSNILAWRIPWMEEPGGLQSAGLQRVRQDSVTNDLKQWISKMNIQCKDEVVDLSLGISLSRKVRASPVAQTVKSLRAMQETRVQSLGQEDPLEKAMATHYSILAWRIPWTEESGGLQFIGSQRVRHN